MVSVDVAGHVSRYLATRTPGARYSSFDFCFNYFQRHLEDDNLDELAGEGLQLSCMHLGFYLASWGMMRGSSQLLQRSAHSLVPVIELVADRGNPLWGLDLEAYDAGTISVLIEQEARVREALGFRATWTLTTKLMLGVFGCVPAFDRFFQRGFGASGFRRKHLVRLGEWGEANRNAVDEVRPLTLDFKTGESTHRPYTSAKVADMVFFMQGGG